MKFIHVETGRYLKASHPEVVFKFLPPRHRVSPNIRYRHGSFHTIEEDNVYTGSTRNNRIRHEFK